MRPRRDYLVTKTPARFRDVLGMEISCRDHGLLGWVRTSLANAVLAAHVQRFHTLVQSGRTTHAFGETERPERDFP